MGDNMEKEKVLEIEIKKINNEYSAFYPIKMDIDKLTEISDGKSLGDGEYTPYIELRISGYCYEIYLTYTEIFPQVIKNNCIEELKQRISNNISRYEEIIFRIDECLNMVQDHKDYGFIQMKYFGRMTYEEIAEKLDIHIANTYKMRNRILEALEIHFKTQRLIEF